MSLDLPAPLVDRILARYPPPVADAVCALEASDSLHERRDRVVEVFRTTVRLLAALSLCARLQYGAGPAEERSGLIRLLRTLRRGLLTDGQWVALTRELLRPWAGTPEQHPLPELVEAFHAYKAPLPKVLDGLLAMRKSETVAHGATGDAEELSAVLSKRLPQLVRLLESLGPLWERIQLVVPLSVPSGETQTQSTWRLAGVTPNRGRWRRVELGSGVRLEPGQPVLLGPGGAPLLALHPVALFRRPSPDVVEELFVLEGSGRRGALYVALPSLAEHWEAEVWELLDAALLEGEQASEAAGPEGTGRPYRGLMSFGSEDAALFFGREEQAEALANRIRREPLVTVTGPSGGGKTSLLQAGVLPQLGELRAVVLRPGAEPLQGLARRLHEAFGGELAWDEVEAAARSNPAGLGEQLWRWSQAQGQRLLVLVDQAEELFTLCRDDAAREGFAAALASLGSDPDGPTRVVLSVREDFFGRLASLGALRGVCSRQVEVVATPDFEALLRTLYLPAERFGFVFEDAELPTQMVRAVEGEPAALALLQFCADKLWDARDRSWKRLTWSAYRALGGVEGALASHAEATLEGLTPAQQEGARAMFLRLVTAEGTRAVVPRPELLAATEDPAAASAILDQLLSARLLTAQESLQGGEPDVELVHEALLVHWRRLRTWLDEDREGQRMLLTLRNAAVDWDARGRPRGLLWRDEALEEHLLWRRRSMPRLTPVERAFSDASERELLRGRRVRRGLAGGLLLAASGVALVLGLQWRAAEQARQQEVIERASAQLQDARSAWSQNEVLEARAKLRASLEAVDSIEARALWAALAREATVWIKDFGGTVRHVHFSPDGKQIAAACLDESIHLVDVETMSDLVLRGHEDQVSSALFAPDGETLVSASWDGEIRVWGLNDLTYRSLVAHDSPMILALSPDGSLLASGGREGNLNLWSLSGPPEPTRLVQGAYAVGALAFGPKGDEFAAAQSDGVVSLWDVRSGEQTASYAGHAGLIRSLAFSPDGETLASGGADWDIVLWDRASGSVRQRLAQHSATVRALAFSGDGDQLISGGLDREVLRWDVSTGEPPVLVREHEGGISSVVFSPDGSLLASSGYDGFVRVWRNGVAPGQSRPKRGHSSSIGGLAFSPDGSVLSTGAGDRTIRQWDVESGREERVLSGHSNAVYAMSYSEDGSLLASSDLGKTVLLWDSRTGERLEVLAGHTSSLQWVTFEPSSRRMMTTGVDGRIILWDTPSGTLIYSHEYLDGFITEATFTPDEDEILFSSTDSAAHRFALSSGEIVQSYTGHTATVESLHCLDDCSTFVTVSDDQTVRVWDTETGEHRVLGEHEGRAYAVDVHPAGRRIATASADGTARIWDLETGAYISLVGHRAEVNRVAFSPEGRYAATVSDDSTVRLWDVDSGQPVWRAPAMLRSPPELLTHEGWIRLDGRSASEELSQSAWRLALEARARVASVSRDQGSLCISDSRGRLELWSLEADELLAAHDLGSVERVLASTGCCVVLGEGLVHRLDRAGEPTLLVEDARSMGLDDQRLLIGTTEAVMVFDSSGASLFSLTVPEGVTALGRVGDLLALGFQDGNIELIPFQEGSGLQQGAASFPFDGIPSSAPTRLIEGPEGTVVVGYANGFVGVWSAESRALLDHAKIHGSIAHLLLEGGTVYAASDLGDYVALDLTTLTQDYCTLLDELWGEVTVQWVDGHAVHADPDPDHPCAER